MELAATADICKVLSDPHRLRIMRALVDGEKCASELLRDFTISQPTLSHHMKTLVEAELLTDEAYQEELAVAIAKGIESWVVK